MARFFHILPYLNTFFFLHTSSPLLPETFSNLPPPLNLSPIRG